MVVEVDTGRVLSTSYNEVTGRCDPTAHAEIQAIRAACEIRGHHQLDGCVLYSSCEPCPMCLGAIYWARPDAVYFAASRTDAAEGGFDDAMIYEQLAVPSEERKIPFRHMALGGARRPFDAWRAFENKKAY